MVTNSLVMKLSDAMVILARMPMGSFLPVKLRLDGRTASAIERKGNHIRMCRYESDYRKGPKDYYIWAIECPADKRQVPKRMTSNMLNPAAGEFEIDEDTPACCDPSTETYHSM
jgi:hypothetical protein